MIPEILQILYIDLQAAVTVCFCENCGGECYHESRLCPDCEEAP